MIKVTIGIVLFSKRPLESETVITLGKVNFLDLGIKPFFFVRDNSEDGFCKEELTSTLGQDIYYEHDKLNKPLSKVYNDIVNYSKLNDLIILLDDDSVLDINYFKEVINFYQTDSVLAIPTISNNGTMISPGKVVCVKGCSLEKDKIRVGNENTNIVAMMSGTVARASLFLESCIKFNEKLAVYGVDTRFFIDCNLKKIGVYILDYELIHSSALREANFTFEDMYGRLTNLLEAQFYIHNYKKYYKVYLFLYLPVFILGKALRLKDMRFLRLFKCYKFFWKLNDE